MFGDIQMACSLDLIQNIYLFSVLQLRSRYMFTHWEIYSQLLIKIQHIKRSILKCSLSFRLRQSFNNVMRTFTRASPATEGLATIRVNWKYC